MSNNAPDYENDLVFPPQEVKSQDDIKHQDTRSSDVLVTALEKCEKLERQLHIVLGILLRVSPSHEGYVRANFPEFYKEQANVWFE